MILEYGHIYVEDIINSNISIRNLIKEINISKNICNDYQQEHKRVVLIDDKEFDLSVNDKRKVMGFVKELYNHFGLIPDEMFFEKTFHNKIDQIYEHLDKNKLVIENFRKSNKKVEFLISGGEKIPLKEIKNGVSNYSCQLLSSLWLMHKKDNLCLNDFKTVTVLDSKYKKVESQVMNILKEANLGEHYLTDNGYVWI